MSSELLSALAPLLERFKSHIHSDPRLRSEIVNLGRALVAFAEYPPRGETSGDSPTQTPSPVPPHAPPTPWSTSPARRMDDREHSHEEQLGWMPQEPAIIAGRCRAKGAAAKLVAQKMSGAIDEQQFQAGVIEVRSQAEKLPKCSLWMLDLSLSKSQVVWDDLAGGYETAAESAELLQVVNDPNAKADADQILQALNLSAEAQSLLFSAVIDTGNPRPDADQIQLYVTVRELATARNTYIHRYLRREDRVDPRTWPDLRKRIAAAGEPLGEFKRRAGNAKKIINNLRFKLKKAGTDGAAKYDEWPRVMELLDEALSSGLPVTDAEVREAMLPFAEQLPEDLMIPVSVGALFREWDKYLVTHPSIKPEPLSPDALQLAARVKARTVVVIGGLVREQERTAIQRAFELASVDWVTLPEQAANLSRMVDRPEVALVLFSVRWTPGDSFAEVQRVCSGCRKPLVRLPGSYTPNAIAHEIVEQFRPS